eukprot:gene23093-30288_t
MPIRSASVLASCDKRAAQGSGSFLKPGASLTRKLPFVVWLGFICFGLASQGSSAGAPALSHVSSDGLQSALAGLPMVSVMPMRTHSHNDEAQGELIVGHDYGKLDLSRKFEDIYVRPLAELVAARGGRLYPAGVFFDVCQPAMLQIDSKAEEQRAAGDNVTEEEMYDAVEKLLRQYNAEYPGTFETFDLTSRLTSGGLMALLSDGRLPDLALGTHAGSGLNKIRHTEDVMVKEESHQGEVLAPVTVYPLISCSFANDSGAALPWGLFLAARLSKSMRDAARVVGLLVT